MTLSTRFASFVSLLLPSAGLTYSNMFQYCCTLNYSWTSNIHQTRTVSKPCSKFGAGFWAEYKILCRGKPCVCSYPPLRSEMLTCTWIYLGFTSLNRPSLRTISSTDFNLFNVFHPSPLHIYSVTSSQHGITFFDPPQLQGAYPSLILLTLHLERVRLMSKFPYRRLHHTLYLLNV